MVLIVNKYPHVENIMNLVFSGTFVEFLSSFNLAIAFIMLCYYALNSRQWNKLSKFGWLVMAGGLLLQSITVIDRLDFDDSWFLYFWAIKNIGGGAFVLGLLSAWAKKR